MQLESRQIACLVSMSNLSYFPSNSDFASCLKNRGFFSSALSPSFSCPEFDSAADISNGGKNGQKGYSMQKNLKTATDTFANHAEQSVFCMLSSYKV